MDRTVVIVPGGRGLRAISTSFPVHDSLKYALADRREGDEERRKYFYIEEVSEEEVASVSQDHARNTLSSKLREIQENIASLEDQEIELQSQLVDLHRPSGMSSEED